ncbi:CPBP family intramembrane metalloprotease [Planctomycetota bacterium]|nr:CPBP family intramembrane metalloprotease [Planctomycetota bacterium]
MINLFQLAQAATDSASNNSQIISSLDQLSIEYIFIPIALVIIAILFFTKQISKSTFNNSPAHNPNFDLFDLLSAIGLYVIGTVLYSYILTSLAQNKIIPGLVLSDNNFAFTDETLGAASGIVAQAFIYAGPVMYVIWKTGLITTPPVVGQPIKTKFSLSGLQSFGLLPTRPFRDLFVGIIAFIAALPTIMAATTIAMIISILMGQTIDTLGHSILQTIATTKSNLTILFYAISAVLIAPVVEEVIFRGVIQTTFINTLNKAKPADQDQTTQPAPGAILNRSRWIVIVVSAILFMSIHIPAVPNWPPLLGHFTLGLFLAWLYEKYNSLLPCITLHLLFNAVNFGYVLLTASQYAA